MIRTYPVPLKEQDMYEIYTGYVRDMYEILANLTRYVPGSGVDLIGGWRSEDGGQKSEVGGRKWQKAKGRGQRSEVAEGKRQRAKVRSRRSESSGSWQ